jgi:Bacterial regulatory protein, arsR family
MEQTAKLFNAFGEPARFRIANLRVRDLQKVLKASQPYVSRHLAFLRAVGLFAVHVGRGWTSTV